MLKYLRRAILISEIYFGCTKNKIHQQMEHGIDRLLDMPDETKKNKILKAEPTAAKSLQLYLTL